MRGNWPLANGLSAGLRLERFAALSEQSDGGAAVAGTANYQSPSGLWAGRASAEWSGRGGNETWYGSLGAAWRIDEAWSILVQDRAALAAADNGRRRLLNRLRTGVAYRPATTNRVNLLGWYEWRRRDDDAENTARHLWSVSGDWQPIPSLRLTGRYAGKLTRQRLAPAGPARPLHQIALRLTYDLTDRIDLGLVGSSLFETGFRSSVRGLGVEGGYLLGANLWLSAGYNFLGYDEEDLGAGHHRGPYLRLRMKLHEDLFAWLQ